MSTQTKLSVVVGVSSPFVLTCETGNPQQATAKIFAGAIKIVQGKKK